jgi:hypothetical protein
MSVPTFLKKTAVLSLGVFFASSLVLTPVITAVAGAQEVGPQPPQPKQQQDNPVAKAITKFVKSKKAAKDDTGSSQDAQGSNAQDAGQDTTGTPAITGPSAMPSQSEALKHAPLLNQPPLTNARIEPPQIDDQNPPVLSHPKLDDPTNPLGFADAENKLKHYSTLVDAKRYNEAKPGLLQLRQSLVDLTEAHIGLFKTLNQIPSASGQAELEKELALQFAQLRDQAMLQTAKIYISERDYPRAVKELTEVVKSQPRSRIGLRSYELLQEIGFTEKLQLAQ